RRLPQSRRPDGAPADGPALRRRPQGHAAGGDQPRRARREPRLGPPRGRRGGWPCLERGDVSSGGVAACLAGHTKDEVYANPPSWSRPVVAQTGNPQVTGLAVSTSLGYPEEFYGDVFYLLRDSARIYRIDLQPPCSRSPGTQR